MMFEQFERFGSETVEKNLNFGRLLAGWLGRRKKKKNFMSASPEEYASISSRTYRGYASMKPLDVIQLVLGIIVGTCVLRPDIAGIPPATQEVEWPREVELTKQDENKVEGIASKSPRLLSKARSRSGAASLPTALASMPPRAGAFVGRRSSFWGKRGNLDVSSEEKANTKEEENIMIATHHGCEVF